MSEKERPPLQLPFGAEKLKDVWFFPEGTVIWPERGRRGVVQNGLYAERLEKTEVRGLSGFRALNNCTLYLDRRYWTLQKGFLFEAYTKNGRRVKLDQLD